MNSDSGIAPSPPRKAPRRGRVWVAALLIVLLAASAGGGALWWRIRETTGSTGPDLPQSTSSTKPSWPAQDECSDNADPKYLDPLEFGPPIQVAFDRAALDALADRPIPPVEVYPWQPKELVAVFGEHRMRGTLVEASPDGKRLAVSSIGDRFIRIGPVATLHESSVLVCPGGVRTMCWSPSGKTLAVGGGDGVVRLHDMDEPAGKSAPIPLNKGATAGVITCLSFSGDGKHLIGGDNTPNLGVAWVWAVMTRKVVQKLQHTGPVVSVAFSPVASDPRALTGGGPGDAELHLWDALAGKELSSALYGKKEDSNATVGHVAFSPDGKRALSCHHDHLVRVWDLTRLAKGKELHAYAGHVGNPLAAFSPDGKTVVTARSGDRGIWQWEAGQSKQVRRLAQPATVHALRFLNTDRLIYTATTFQDHNLHLVDVEAGEEVQSPVGHLMGLSSVTLAPDGGSLVSAAYHVRLWRLSDGKQRYMTAVGSSPRVGFHPDSRRYFYFVPSHSSLGLIDVETRKPVGVAFDPPHSGGIHSVAITRDGRYALTGGHHDGTVRMYDLRSGRQLRKFDFGPGQGAATVTVAPDMRRALRAGGGTVRLLQLRCQRSTREWPGPLLWTPFLPDGRAVFLGGISAPVWEITKDGEKEVAKFPLDVRNHSAGALSGDGKRVAAVVPGKVAVFELASGKELWAWTPPSHFGGVASVALSTDGGHLATANGDGTAYVIRLP